MKFTTTVPTLCGKLTLLALDLPAASVPRRRHQCPRSLHRKFFESPSLAVGGNIDLAVPLFQSRVFGQPHLQPYVSGQP